MEYVDENVDLHYALTSWTMFLGKWFAKDIYKQNKKQTC